MSAERIVAIWVVVLLFIFVGIVVVPSLPPIRWSTGLTGPWDASAWAGWVQGIGTIVAVGVTAWAAMHGATRQERLSARSASQALIAQQVQAFQALRAISSAARETLESCQSIRSGSSEPTNGYETSRRRISRGIAHIDAMFRQTSPHGLPEKLITGVIIAAQVLAEIQDDVAGATWEEVKARPAGDARSLLITQSIEHFKWLENGLEESINAKIALHDGQTQSEERATAAQESSTGGRTSGLSSTDRNP